jgi:hypothetical protein
MGVCENQMSTYDSSPSSLMDLAQVQGENTRRKRSWGALFGSQHFEGKGHVGALVWGLGRLTSNSITHMDLHKPNNKLVKA